MWSLIHGIGRVPKTLVWDREAAIGGTGKLTTSAAAFAGTLATRIKLDHGIGLLTDTATRDRVLYTLSLAKAYATSADNRTGDIDRACHEAATILPLLTHVSSARCRTQLTDLIATLRHHRGHDVRDLREQAAQALAAPV